MEIRKEHLLIYQIFYVIQELRFSRKIRGSQGFSPIPPSSAAPPFPMLKSERLKSPYFSHFFLKDDTEYHLTPNLRF